MEYLINGQEASETQVQEHQELYDNGDFIIVIGETNGIETLIEVTMASDGSEMVW